MSAAPMTGSFFERTRAAKKIIVVDFGFLGDSVHLTPALWEIKKKLRRGRTSHPLGNGRR